MIALGLSLLVVVAAFEFLGITRSLFSKVKDAQENSQAVQAALLKLRIDLIRAGFGLAEPLRAGVIEGIEIGQNSFTVLSLDDALILAADVVSGEKRIPLDKVSGLSRGRRVCLAEEDRAEAHTVSALDGHAVILTEPLETSYSAAAGRLLLLEEVRYYLDAGSGNLRRKVNASPAQPMLDDTSFFVPLYERETNLFRIRLASNASQERIYEFSIFPKNLGLSHL